MLEQSMHRQLALPNEAENSTRRAMHSASVIAAVSSPVADHAYQMGARDVIVVPNAVDPEPFASPATSHTGNRRFTS